MGPTDEPAPGADDLHGPEAHREPYSRHQPTWHVPSWSPGLTAVGLATFLALTTGAALVYPGGSADHRDAPAYSVVHNYWCDLYRGRAYDGAPHPGAGAALLGAVGVIVAVGAGLVTASGYPGTAPSSRRLTRALVVVACLVMPVVPFTPADRYGRLHFVLIAFAAIPALGAFALGAKSVYRGAAHTASARALRGLTVVAGVATAIHFGHYLLTLFGGGEYAAGIPLEQKVVSALELLWLALVARAARRSARPGVEPPDARAVADQCS